MLLNTQAVAKQNQVNANDYRSFWIWGRISSAPYLSQAKELYILQGEFRLDRHTHTSTFTQHGVGVLKLPRQKVWLVFRNHHLNWQNQELNLILKRVRQWENAGNQIVGIQIDYDSKTKNLKEYAYFLDKIRKQLPVKYKLSITGLMDWTNQRDPNTLNMLRNSLDELVIQTYQGSTTIPNYQQYIQKIATLKLPYKIGIVQHGLWDQKINLNKDPNFKGYVVFLLRQNQN
ncbi:DUF3142 domain-containing protein [Acinetobacter sp. 194]|uniref:DUF3142 domain-containing protein n=1 Tax=Acinetobacter shaoyimingii TaxID=2715164 RepID=UPI001408A7A8|nr:DUF3142 domain-containing protein [Acinetobacter shaoyimingii]NHB57139.1 DUF3142 domain-containing protein [Acinetobacter shaoyimingii]